MTTTVANSLQLATSAVQGQFRGLSRCRDALAGISVIYLAGLTIQKYLNNQVVDAVLTGFSLPLVISSYYYSKRYGDITAITEAFARQINLLDINIQRYENLTELVRQATTDLGRPLEIQAAEDETAELIRNMRLIIQAIIETLNAPPSDEELFYENV